MSHIVLLLLFFGFNSTTRHFHFPFSWHVCTTTAATWQCFSALLCPSHNDPCTYRSAPPAVSCGSSAPLHTRTLSEKWTQHVSLDTRACVYIYFITVYVREHRADGSPGAAEETCRCVMHRNNMHVRFRCLLNLGGRTACCGAAQLGSARLGSVFGASSLEGEGGRGEGEKKQLHAGGAVDAASCANVSVGACLHERGNFSWMS